MQPNKLNAAENYKQANAIMLDTLTAKGWKIDSFGHATKPVNGKLYRYKFQALTIRYEVQAIYSATAYSPATKGWVRIKSYRYKKK